MAAGNGKTSPFDGTGGKGVGSAFSHDQSLGPRPAGPGAHDPKMVPPGGPLPFTPPSDARGGPLGSGTMGKPAPYRVGGK